MFTDAHCILAWAYETTTRPIVKMSGANNMRQEPTKGIPNSLLSGLGPQELHGQAGQVIGMVERLHSLEAREYIGAKFGRKLTPNDLRILIYRGCDTSGLRLSGQEAVYRVVHSYFGGDLPYRTLRKMLGCSNQNALLVKSCLYGALDHIHDRAMADITEVFEQHGLIESRSSMTE